MFSDASNFVHGSDMSTIFIGGFAVFFLVSFTIIMIYFVVKFNRKRNPKATQVKDNVMLEATWIALPTLLVILMFYIGWEGFLPMRQDPKDAMHVKAIGRMWKWSFEYPGNKTSDTLVLPIDKAVRVDLFSKDVIHGFFVPAFRIKEDVVPGKNNYSWFIPGELGDFDLICSAYCGVNHSYMSAVIRIVSQQKYDEWIAALPAVSAVSSNPGFTVLQNNACTGCHSIDGSPLVGPSFKGLFGSTIDVKTNGVLHKVKVDEEYIETSIYDPDKDIAKNFTPGIMKPYKNIIKDNDIKLINDYLKTLK